MARKKKHEEHENHERWLVSYADFITLLFAFFVVMYSISSVNEGKYRVLSDALISSFRSPDKSMEPVQVGRIARTAQNVQFRTEDTSQVVMTPNLPLPPRPPEQHKKGAAEGIKAPGKGKASSEEKAMGEISKEIAQSMAPLIKQDLISIRSTKQWIEVEMKADVLFASGSARLAMQSLPILERLANILRPFPNPIRIEGYTDNVPINTAVYPSNWELSAARAASVVHLFSEFEIAPQRMVAVGYGQYRPIASNDTPEGRRTNRRVVLVISAGNQQRQEAKATPEKKAETVQQELRQELKSPAGKSAPTAPAAEPAKQAPAAPAKPAGSEEMGPVVPMVPQTPQVSAPGGPAILKKQAGPEAVAPPPPFLLEPPIRLPPVIPQVQPKNGQKSNGQESTGSGTR